MTKQTGNKHKTTYRVRGFSIVETARNEINKNENQVRNFIIKYIACEYTCKQIIEKVDHVDISKIKMHTTTISKCFKSYGVVIDTNDLKELFGSERKKNRKSCKTLRNEIVHELNKSAIKEIMARYNDLNNLMDKYLKIIVSL